MWVISMGLVRVVNFGLPDFTLPLGPRQGDAAQIHELGRRRTVWAESGYSEGAVWALFPACSSEGGTPCGAVR